MKFNEIDFSLKNILITLFIFFIIYLAYTAKTVILVVTISILIAYLLNPIVNFLSKKHIHRYIAVFLTVAFFTGIIIGAILILLPITIQEISIFISNMPEYFDKSLNFFINLLEKYNINTSSFDFNENKEFFIGKLEQVSSYLIKWLSSTFESIKSFISIMINIFLVPTIVFFLLIEFPRFEKFFLDIVERLNMKHILAQLSQFEKLIGQYFRGMFLVGIILSCLYGAVLYFVGTKLWFLWGMITGFGAMIPYIGFSIGITTSLIATIITFQDIWHPIYLVIGFVGVQILESFIITPKIVGDSLGISPAVVVIAMIIGGAIGGLLGMIISLPVAAFIKIKLDKFLEKKANNKAEGGEIPQKVKKKEESKEKNK